MPTRTHDRFTPRGSPSREELQAYAEGRLDATAQHQVEMHLEADPLLREAMEGMRIHGSTAPWDELAEARPGPRPAWGLWTAGGAVVLATIGWLWWSAETPHADRDTTPAETPAAHSPDQSPVPLAFAEIEAATEIPETLHIGHAITDRHAQVAEALVERTHLEPIGSRPIEVEHPVDPPALVPEHATIHAAHWIYLHELKLADPKELYATEPLLITEPEHVPARFADGEQRTKAEAEQRRMRYTPFMDVALGKFQQGDHKGCLEELRFLMTQYPNDVNALLYGGLCCYNLGMNARAEEFLYRAATHPISIFDQEATWYHALTLERLGEREKARSEFARIAAGGGFYAGRAKERSGRP